MPVETPAVAFGTVTITELAEVDHDTMDFGVVQLDADCKVTAYNTFESELAGLAKERVLGRDFFSEVAPCMNNFMVAQKIQDAQELDEVVPYVLTLKMLPKSVRLRLLRSASSAAMYVLVERA